MRLPFRRRERIAFYHFDRHLKGVMSVAARDGGPSWDSLDLLVALAESARGADATRRAGLDPVRLVEAAREAGSPRSADDAPTPDAKAVIEAVAGRSLAARRDAGLDDLLMALATADCRARRVLEARGLNGVRLKGS
jgi:hypothetical protein